MEKSAWRLPTGTFQFMEEALVLTDLQGKVPWFTQTLNYPIIALEHISANVAL